MFAPAINTVPEVLELDDCTFPTITIALTNDVERSALLQVRLWPVYWDGEAVDELKFVILVFDDRSEEPEEIWDRDKAASYVESVRPLVMECVCAAARVLADKVQPQVIAMRTWAEWPPEKSLLKYHLITDMFEIDGFETTEGTDPRGRQFWVMIKDGDTSCEK